MSYYMSKNVYDQTPYYRAVDSASFFVSGFCLNFSCPETVHQLELMNYTFFNNGDGVDGEKGIAFIAISIHLMSRSRL